MAEVKNLYLGVDHLVPTEDRLVIKRIKRPTEQVTGGIIINTGRVMDEKGEFKDDIKGTQEEENTYYADVIAVGPKVKAVTIENRIMISKFAGIELMKGTDVFMIKEGDVMALVA